MSVNLSKGSVVSLTKNNDSSLSEVFLGLGWDVAQKKGLFSMFSGETSIDLDASCVMFDRNKQKVDVVWFRQLKSRDGSVLHTGDNRTGEGDGDDEVINVNLSRVPANVETLVFVINSFTGQSFDKIEKATCRLVNDKTGEEIVTYSLSDRGPHTAQIMAKVFRENGGWSIKAIGEKANGRVYEDLLPTIINLI